MVRNKSVNDLISPLFVITCAVNHLKEKLDNIIDYETLEIVSKMQKSLLEVLDIVEELRKKESKTNS